MIKTLQLISSSGFFGADNVLFELSRNLDALGLFPVVGVFRDAREPHLEVAEVADRHGLETMIFPCRGRMDWGAVLAIRQFMKSRGVDIVHSHGYKSNAYALAATAGGPFIRISTCHNWPSAELKMKLYASLDKVLLNGFDRIVAVSDQVSSNLSGFVFSRDKVATIYNGIDVGRFDSTGDGYAVRRELGIAPDATVIGTVGRLAEEKGYPLLIESAVEVLKRFPKAVFLFVGDGPLRERLEAKGQEVAAGLEGKMCPFVFAGVRKDMPAVYSAMDIFVLSSLREGLPMVLLEAMASKKPVLATSVGAIPDVVRSGHSGLLVAPGDPVALSKGIIELLANPERAKSLAENGRLRVEKGFSSKAMAEKYVEIYEDVLRRKGRKSIRQDQHDVQD